MAATRTKKATVAKTTKTTAKKAPAKKASPKAAAKPKAPANILAAGTFAKFLGYRSDVGDDEIVFEAGESIYIIGSEEDDDSGLLYEAIKASDVGEYNENGEANVTGGEVSPVEVSELKGGALEKAREAFVPVPATGRLAELLQDLEGSAVDAARELNKEIQETSFWLGGALAMVLQQGAYLTENGGDYEGEEAFNDFCQDEFDFKASKGRQLARIYVTFSALEGFDPARIDDIGWSKAAIAERFVTDENVEEVLALASNSTQRELGAALKERFVTENATPSGKVASRGAQIVKTKLMYSLDEDSAVGVQLAIKACMSQEGIESESLALEFICVQWAEQHVQAATTQKKINQKIAKSRKAREKAEAPKEAPAAKAKTPVKRTRKAA
jgi:hypothetical protein